MFVYVGAAAGGLAVIFHPGRYWKLDDAGEIPSETVQYYVGLFRKHDHLFGVEIINQGQRYKHDVDLWDEILAEVMPDRPVWGYANDDVHTPDALGRDVTMFLLTASTKQSCARPCGAGVRISAPSVRMNMRRATWWRRP